MLFLRGGSQIASGHYWAPADGSWVDGRKEQLLPGTADTLYLRVHPVAMFLLAPVIGLVFFLTLPAITILVAVAVVIARIAREVVQSVSRLAYFEWRPNEAYLAGKSRKDKRQGSDHEDDQVSNDEDDH
ncbi:MAG: hypothetical protein PVF51_06865 [Nitrospirota bacterium]